MNRRKIINSVMIAIITALNLFTLLSPQQAKSATTDGQVTVNLHKLVFGPGQLPNKIQNDGTTATAELLKNGTPLADVTYQAYNVTEAFYQMRQEDSDASIEEIYDKLDPSVGEQVGIDKVTDEEGLVQFVLSEQTLIDGEPRNSVYLFHEANAPETITVKAPDMVLGLPAYRFDTISQTYTNERLTDIHLYPKNEDPPTLDKIVDSDRDDFGYGDAIPYKITTLVPAVIDELEQYYLVDIADENLELIPDSLKVAIEDLPESQQPYEITFDGEDNFRIDFKPSELKDYANKEVTITYQMKLKPGAPADQWLINESHIYLNAFRVDSEARVITGGKRFVKTDLTDSDRQLADATFVVRNSAGEYLSLQDDAYEWLNVCGDVSEKYEAENLTTLTSNASGKFDIEGLAYNDYQLVKVKAPAGYVKLTDPIDFSVDENTYQNGAVQAPEQVVHNIPETVIEPPIISEPQLPESGSQKPGLGGFLPQTGEMQSTLLVLIGLIIIAVAGYFYKRQQNKKGKGA